MEGGDISRSPCVAVQSTLQSNFKPYSMSERVPRALCRHSSTSVCRIVALLEAAVEGRECWASGGCGELADMEGKVSGARTPDTSIGWLE